MNHVVTSARIVFTDQNLLRPVAQFAIRAGSITFLDGFATTVIAVFPHPEFDPWTFNDDIAVLRVRFYNVNCNARYIDILSQLDCC